MGRITRNIEVRVAMLRNEMAMIDIAELFSVPKEKLQRVFAFEMPGDVQTALITLVNKIGAGEAPTREDVQKYDFVRSYIRNYKAYDAQPLNNTVAFAKWVKDMHEYKTKEDFDALNDTFNITAEVKYEKEEQL